MSLDYATWAAQQHQYLMSAGGYGPPPDAPPPDQTAAPDNSTWGGMAAAPPVQDAPPAPPPPSPDYVNSLNQESQYNQGNTYNTGTPAAQQVWNPPPADTTYQPGPGQAQIDQQAGGGFYRVDPAEHRDQYGNLLEAQGPSAAQTPEALGDPNGPHNEVPSPAMQASIDYGQMNQQAANLAPQASAADQAAADLPGAPGGFLGRFLGDQARLGLAVQQKAAQQKLDEAAARGDWRPQPGQRTPQPVPAPWLGHDQPPVLTAQSPYHQGEPQQPTLDPLAAGLHAAGDYLGALKATADAEQRAALTQQLQAGQAAARNTSLAHGADAAGPALDVNQNRKLYDTFGPPQPAASGYQVPAAGMGNPLDALGSAAGSLGAYLKDNGLNAIQGLDKPRQGVLEHVTQQALDQLQGKPQSEAGVPGIDQLQGGPILADYKGWIFSHPDRAIGDATNGYGLDPQTGQPFVGPRAVWEDYISDKPAPVRILLDTLVDPLSYLPPADKAVEGVGVSGRLLERAGVPGAAAVARVAEKVQPVVEHPLQSIGRHLPDWAYPTEVRNAREERAIAADAEEALNTPRVQQQPQQAAPQAPAQQTAPQGPPPQANPPQTPPTNGHAQPAPAPTTNGHAPGQPLPPVTVPANGAAPAPQPGFIRPLIGNAPPPAVTLPPVSAVPPEAIEAAPIEPGALSVQAPPAEARPPSEGAQRLDQAAADLTQMAQTGEVPSAAETAVQQARREAVNAPSGTPVEGGTDFGHGVVAHTTPNDRGRFSISIDGVPQRNDYATERQAQGAANAIAQHRDAQATLAGMRDVPGALYNADDARAARNRLYRSGQLNKSYKPGTPGYQNFVDLQASRLTHSDPEIADATRAGLQHDLELRPTSDSRARPLDPRVYNDIMDKAGTPYEKINPRTFYAGPDGARFPLIAGHTARSADWPSGEVGRLEKAASDGLGVVVQKPDGTRETVPIGKLDLPGVENHTPSDQALGFIAKPTNPLAGPINAVQQAHPHPLKQVEIAPDLTQPIAKNPWFETLDPTVSATLNKKINVGTFTAPNHVALGDILARDQDQLLGWKDLRDAGITHINPTDPAFPDLFAKGIVDAAGDLDEAGINKQLVRLGLADKTGALTDLGRSMGAKSIDDLKANLVKSPDQLVNHLIAQAAAVDYGVSQGFRNATTRAASDARTAVGKALDGFMNYRRAVALTNIASGPRYGLMQAIGNAVTLAIAKPTALLDYTAPIEAGKMWRAAKDIRVPSEVEKTLRDAGLPQSQLLRELGPMGTNPIAKATWLGPLRHPAQAIFANDVYRRFGNVFDGLVRTSLFKNKWDEQYPRILGALPDHIAEGFRALNVQLPHSSAPFPNWEDEVKTLVAGLNVPGKTGRVFSPTDLRQALMTVFDDHLRANPTLITPGRDVWRNFADHMAQDWNTALKGVRDAAETEVRRVAFDFDPTKADQFVSRLFMFHFWQSRAGGLYAVEALKNPKYVATLVRAMNALENQAKAENAPAFLQWFYKYGQTPDGLAMWFNPTNLIQVWSTGLLMNAQSGDDPTAKKDLTGLGHFLQGPYGSMLFMNPVVQGALTAVGALGPDAKTPDLLGDSQAIQRLETFVNEWNVDHPTITDGKGHPTLVTIPDSRTAINVAMQWLHRQNPMLGTKAQNVNAGDQITFRNLVFDQVKQENPDATPDELAAKAAKAAADPASPEYQAALQGYVASKTAGPGTGHGPFGNAAGWFLRMGLGDSMFTTTDPNADAAAARSYGTKEDQARAGFVFSSGSQEDALNAAQDRYFKPGTGTQQASYDMYNAIKSGNAVVADEQGNRLSLDQLRAMTPQQRQVVADAWLVRHPKDAAAVQAIYDQRDQIVKANPDLGGWLAMKDLAEANPAGVDEWIATTRQRNPGYDQYLAGMEQKYGGTDNDGYRKAAFFLDGYRALVGLPSGFANQNPSNPHPDVPGLEKGQTLADFYFAQQAASGQKGADIKQSVLDSLRQTAAVKQIIDAYDPSGYWWGVYVTNANLPSAQRAKLPYALYTQIKGKITGSDGNSYEYPSGYAAEFLAQDQPFDQWWTSSEPAHRLASDQKKADQAAFDPNALNGSAAPAAAPAGQTPAKGRAVTTADLNLRDGPNGNVLGVGPHGTVVDVLDVQGDWVQVRLADGSTGWMYGAYLRKQ